MISYLVSTAGHSQSYNESHPHDIRTILQLIEEGAEESGDEKVVGFAQKSGESWGCDRYSFKELLTLSSNLAHNLQTAGIPLRSEEQPQPTAALLCPTGLEFLVTWIALMRMGYGVLFIAPQCSPSAITSLLKSTNSTHLIYHPMYSSLSPSSTTSIPLPPLSPTNEPSPIPFPTTPVSSISHIFHTSGTSGTPKPIPQNHGQSVSILPRRPYSAQSGEGAVFTTTPLFHGGVSDLLRGWMARGMVYFYPTSTVPITSDNIIASITACNTSQTNRRSQITSFLSVPYILTILTESPQTPGMALLQSMDLVSTGGAPLDRVIGDRMVESGVRLVSRLGSSECGFLLSSHREYETEKDWEWMRNDSAYADTLVFEPVESVGSGPVLYEMVVTDGWKSKTKSNRPDGSYATGDLYSKHPTKSNVWKYAGRGDDVMVMSNGEKASPGPIETILRSSPHLSDALVVGSDKAQLGVLLFPSNTDQPDLSDLLSLLEEANRSSPSHAQISRDMCLVIEPSRAILLPKSSKGTIQRSLAYQLFEAEIKALYEGTKASTPERSLDEITDYLRKLVAGMTAGRGKLQDDTDLFNWGIDSVRAATMRMAIMRDLNTGGQTLPLNVVFENPSIDRLSRYIVASQNGIPTESNSDEAQHKLMWDMVHKYGTFSRSKGPREPRKDTDKGATILLTGATGSLGTHLLHQLILFPPAVISSIICLVRAEDDAGAKTRVEGALRGRGLRGDMQRARFYAVDLAAHELGLGSEVYVTLAAAVDIIIHAAWPVHFGSSLISFEDNIKGTRNLLDLLASSPSPHRHFYYSSSLASVLASPTSPIPESPSNDPSSATPIGYSRSKWVTEQICQRANGSLGLEGRVTVLRVGQLCGDTVKGMWSGREGWPLLIRTAGTTGCLPVLEEKPSWLPVDLAAKAILEIATQRSSGKQPIYHIVHPLHIDWQHLLNSLTKANLAFQPVSPQEWLRRVAATPDDARNPSKQMLPMWEAAYGKANPAPDPIIDNTNARTASPTLRDVDPIGVDLITRMVTAWRATGFLE